MAIGSLSSERRTVTVAASLRTPAAASLSFAAAQNATTALVSAQLPTGARVPTSFTAALTPLGGGTPVVFTSADRHVLFYGLAPNTTYTVAAVATFAGNVSEPVLGSLAFSTPDLNATLSLSVLNPTGAYTAQALIRFLADGPPPANYTLTLTPAGAGGAAVTATCADPASCSIRGLAQGTTYTAVATATLPDGSATAPSATAALATAADTSSRRPPFLASVDSFATTYSAGVLAITKLSYFAPTDYTVYVLPLNGDPPASAICDTPDACSLKRLRQGTDYLVRSLLVVVVVLALALLLLLFPLLLLPPLRAAGSRRRVHSSLEKLTLLPPPSPLLSPQAWAVGNLPDGTRLPTPTGSFRTPPLSQPIIRSAAVISPTEMMVVISTAIVGDLPDNYTLTLTPLDKGYSPIVGTFANPVLYFVGLAPGLTYNLSALATYADGRVEVVLDGVSGSREVSTPTAEPPLTISTANPTGPTTVQVSIAVYLDPPPVEYLVLFTSQDSSPSVRASCRDPAQCLVAGLQPDTTYAVMVMGSMADGSVVPAAGTASVSTPTDGAYGSQISPIIASTSSSSGTEGSVSILWPDASTPGPATYFLLLSPVTGEAPSTQTCASNATNTNATALSPAANSTASAAPAGNTTTCDLNGLTPGSTYVVSPPPAWPPRSGEGPAPEQAGSLPPATESPPPPPMAACVRRCRCSAC